MFEMIDYCDNIYECSRVLTEVYIVPGFLLVWAMTILAMRNPKTKKNGDVSKMGFFAQCFWVLLVMFGASFVVSNEIYEKLKHNSIIRKAITVWCVVLCILVSLIENYEMSYETMLINTQRQIYSGDYQIRDLPTYDVYTILVRIENFKIRKFLGLVLLWFTYTLLTLAFTLYEFVFVAISLLVAILLLIDYRRKGKEEAEIVTSVDIPL